MGLFGLTTRKDVEKIIRQAAFDDTDNISRDDLGNGELAYSPQWLYDIYRNNRIVQTIINSVADDATREGFTIKITKMNGEEPDPDTAMELEDTMLKRYNKLMYSTVKNQGLMREMIKFSRVYEQGSGLFYGIVDSRGPGGVTTQPSDPAPKTFSHLEFVNVFDNPSYFAIQIGANQNPLTEGCGTPRLTSMGIWLDRSRYSWLFNEFEPLRGYGVSVVQGVLTAIDAVDAALRGSIHILDRVGAFKLTSKKNNLAANSSKSIRQLLTLIERTLTSRGGIGLDADDTLELLNFQFSGMGEVFDYTINMLSAVSNIPRSIIIGSMSGGLVTGEGNIGELTNYYRTCANFQDSRLRAIDTKSLDLILCEMDGECWKITNGQPVEYEIEYNSLWDLDETAEANIGYVNAQRDNLDIQDGKLSPQEARSLDPRLKTLDPFTPWGTEPGEEEPIKTDVPPVESDQPPLPVDINGNPINGQPGQGDLISSETKRP